MDMLPVASIADRSPPSPLAALAALAAASALAALLGEALRRRTAATVLRVARDAGMQFVREDRFALATRIAAAFPVIGAADLSVRDVVYGSVRGGRRWVFTAEYTVGTLRGQKRRRAVAGFVEPAELAACSAIPSVTLAPADASRLDQYRALLAQAVPAQPPST